MLLSSIAKLLSFTSSASTLFEPEAASLLVPWICGLQNNSKSIAVMKSYEEWRICEISHISSWFVYMSIRAEQDCIAICMYLAYNCNVTYILLTFMMMMEMMMTMITTTTTTMIYILWLPTHKWVSAPVSTWCTFWNGPCLVSFWSAVSFLCTGLPFVAICLLLPRMHACFIENRPYFVMSCMRGGKEKIKLQASLTGGPCFVILQCSPCVRWQVYWLSRSARLYVVNYVYHCQLPPCCIGTYITAWFSGELMIPTSNLWFTHGFQLANIKERKKVATMQFQ